MNLKRTPRFSRNASGQTVATVPLAKGNGEAELYAEDFELLRANGFTGLMNLNHARAHYWYVRASLRGGVTVTVARAIAGAASGQIVRYRDGNCLNLRRENLYLDAGRAKMDCRLGVDLY